MMAKIRGNKNSQTPGKTKGESCKADWRKRYYFCNPHAYKDKDYSTYHKMALQMNGVKS